LPDDIYLDNLDPVYAELLGTWFSTNTAAWGTNARVALLTSTNAARVRWTLPIVTSGSYNISVQVPPLTKAATNAMFTIFSGGSNVLSLRFPGRIPTNQWVFIGAPFLDAALSNSVEMFVSNSPNKYAIADVLRATPATDSNAPVINHPPIAFLRGLATTMNRSLQISAEQIIGPGYDPDGDLLTVVVSNASSQGGSINTVGTNFVYSPATNFAGLDSFNYTLDDGHGGAASAAVQVLVVNGPLPPSNHVAIVPSATNFVVRFAGSPGAQCFIQRSTNLVDWTTLTTVDTPVYGIVEFSDTNAPAATAFYRVQLP